MITSPLPHPISWLDALFQWLNPVPYGMFFAALIFDICYAASANIMWAHAAAWLGLLALVFAIIPRFINLGHVWFGARWRRTRAARIDFGLNALAIVLAIFNAMVHTRDAYGIVPLNVILSAAVVILLSIARLVMIFGWSQRGEVQ